MCAKLFLSDPYDHMANANQTIESVRQNMIYKKNNERAFGHFVYKILILFTIGNFVC